MHPITLKFYEVESVLLKQTRPLEQIRSVGVSNIAYKNVPYIKTFELILAEDLEEKFDLHKALFLELDVLRGYELFYRNPNLDGGVQIVGEISYVSSWSDRRVIGQFK